MSARDKPKTHPGVHPEEISAVAALAKLFPGHDEVWSFVIPKLSWPAFNPPPPLFEIDEFIKDLIKLGKINDQEWKQKHGARCPYHAARLGVVLAVEWARFAKEVEIRIRPLRQRIASAETKTQNLARLLLDFLDETPNTIFAPKSGRGTAGTNYEELNKALTASVEAYSKIRSAAKALETLSAMAKAAQIPEQRWIANEWAATFAESLGYTWFGLTGERPKNTAFRKNGLDFDAFLESAYRSLDGVQEISWKHQARKALRRVSERPEWNRFDKCENDIDPPGVTPINAEEYNDNRRFQHELWKERMRSYMMAQQSSDAEFRRIAFIDLLAEYIFGSKIEKEFILSLGYRPPPAAMPADDTQNHPSAASDSPKAEGRGRKRPRK